MKKLNSFSIFVAPMFCLSLQAQTIFNNSTITTGFAIQPQDRRLFDFPNYLIDLEETKHDFEYSLLFSKAVVRQKRWVTYLVGGYSLNHATFLRPFDHNYFTGVLSEELRYIEHYLTHNLNLGIGQRLIISESNGNAFYLHAPLMAKFAVRKHINDNWNFGTNKKFNKWLFEPNNVELYLGLGCKFKKVEIGLAYRALNLQKIDPVIFNHILFNTANPDFLDKKYEFKNLTKVWLTVSYRLGEE